MSETKQHYSEEFKEQTVRYIQEQSKSLPQISQEMNVPVYTLRRWLAKYGKFENEPVLDREVVRKQEKQIAEQERTIEDLKEEIAILKKAMHIFSKERN